MTDKHNVMVFIEVNDGQVADVSRELICEAGKLAEQLSVEVEGVAMGHGAEGVLGELGTYGLRRVFYTDDPRLAHFTSVPYAKIISATIREQQPQIVLFGATTSGRDVGPRVASELKCGLTADCTALKIGSCSIKGTEYTDTLLQIRPAFGGNIIATIVSPTSTPSMATVRDGVMQLTAPVAGQNATVIPRACDLSEDHFSSEVLESVQRMRSVDLKGARIVVAAGIGAGDTEGIDLCRRLAAVLGGELGASRAVVDAGLLSKDHQVGQTGTTVRPTLYIACGISGSIQHMAGMQEAQRVIAINSDPGAPILKIAHYGIIGDLYDIIPKMIKAYRGQD